MKKKQLLILFIIIYSKFILAQQTLLSTGPMVGYTTTREAQIWIQTRSEAEVYVEYFTETASTKKWKSGIQKTKQENYFISKILLDTILPGLTYQYAVYINNTKLEFPYKLQFKTPPVWRYQSDPPNFSIATGSGAYINDEPYDRSGKPYGGEYEIFESIASKKPDVMLWLGDNTYLRAEEWNSKTAIAYRYTHTRKTPEMQELLATTSNYAIWDDHDAGPNDCDGSFWNIDNALQIFELFWANPSCGLKNTKGAISYFNYGDADFFLLDNRTHRDADLYQKQEKTILGNQQLEWLKQALASSEAKFKVIVMGGQFLNSAARFETYANYGFEKERNEIIEFIKQHNIKGIFFLSGDRHFSELSLLKTENNLSMYDLTVSPLTSGPSFSAKEEKNENRVDGTLITQRNFAILTFSGKTKDRNIRISIYDVNGKILWEKQIHENDF